MILNAADYPKGGWPPDSIYVGRGSAWGNPYKADLHTSRAQAIERFRRYAERHLRAFPLWLEPLRGKNLVCHCAPLPCHAEVLKELLDGGA